MASDHFQAGLMAYESGKPLDTNPYSAIEHEDVRRFCDWVRGWLSGYDATPLEDRPHLFNLDAPGTDGRAE